MGHGPGVMSLMKQDSHRGSWGAVGSLQNAAGCGEQRGPAGIPLPGYDKEHAADPQVGEENVHPNIRRQRVEEGKHTGVGPVGLPVQNADPQGHKGLGEVYRFFPYVGDGERSNGQVSFLCTARGETQRERERERSH